jgi:hypothetical protein
MDTKHREQVAEVIRPRPPVICCGQLSEAPAPVPPEPRPPERPGPPLRGFHFTWDYRDRDRDARAPDK